MNSQQLELTAMLSERGWKVVARQREDLEWWADEVWTLASEWSPRDLIVFLVWLTDPNDETRMSSGANTWAIAACLQRPATRLEAEAHLLMATKHWPRDVPGFLAELSALRDQRTA